MKMPSALALGHAAAKREKPPLFQQFPINLSPVVLWQRGNEFNPAWVLVRREAGLDEKLEVISQHLSRGDPLARNDESLGLHQAIIIFVSDDGALGHGFMLQQTVLNFRRRD